MLKVEAIIRQYSKPEIKEDLVTVFNLIYLITEKKGIPLEIEPLCNRLKTIKKCRTRHMLHVLKNKEFIEFHGPFIKVTNKAKNYQNTY